MIRSREATPAQGASELLAGVRFAVDGGRSWLLVGLTVTSVYLAWTLLTLMHGSVQDFIHVGRAFVARSQTSSVISGYAGYRYDGEIGFDGQFMFFIGIDPVNARYYVDYPAYRYTRILYPILAGTLGLHQPDLVADALIAVNLAMIALGVCVLGAWLRRRGFSAWLAAVYGFYPGVFVTLQRDTSEIMANSLAIVAIYLFDHGPARWRLVLSAAFFSLGVLTRETTLVFAGVWGLGVLLGGEGELKARIEANWRRFVGFVAIAAGPFLAFKVFLLVWLGSLGLGGVLSPIPFSGIHYLIRHEVDQEQLRTIVVPALLCLAAAIYAIFKGIRRVEVWSLLATAIFYTAFLAPGSLDDLSSSGRVTVPVALAAVVALPCFPQGTRAWFWAVAALWMVPMIYWILIPVEGGLQDLVVHHL
ncbi:MAG: hypothetical protein ACHQ0J_06250 [Candidatus Dormibacterales bacterium]